MKNSYPSLQTRSLAIAVKERNRLCTRFTPASGRPLAMCWAGGYFYLSFWPLVYFVGGAWCFVIGPFAILFWPLRNLVSTLAKYCSALAQSGFGPCQCSVGPLAISVLGFADFVLDHFRRKISRFGIRVKITSILQAKVGFPRIGRLIIFKARLRFGQAGSPFWSKRKSVLANGCVRFGRAGSPF